jgi:hypothetical protein
VAGILGAHASDHIFGNLLIDVKLNFFAELVRGAAAAEQG